MTKPSCLKCGAQWTRPLTSDGVNWRCTNCHEQITVAPADLRALSDYDLQLVADLDRLELPVDEAVAVAEARSFASDARFWDGTLLVTLTGLVTCLVKYERNIRFVSYDLLRYSKPWIAVGVVLVLWHLVSRAGTFDVQLRVTRRRAATALIRRVRTYKPRGLVRGGAWLAMVAGCIRFTLKQLDIRESPLDVPVELALLAAVVMMIVGAMWWFFVEFRTAQSATFSRYYTVLTWTIMFGTLVAHRVMQDR